MNAEAFRYESLTIDAATGTVACRYGVGGRSFEERVTLGPSPRWDTPAAHAAARLLFLLAGVSYYKTAAPPVIDLGDTALTEPERDFLREFYLQGLGEFAYRNGLDLSGLRIEGPVVPASTFPEISEMSDYPRSGRDGRGQAGGHDGRGQGGGRGRGGGRDRGGEGDGEGAARRVLVPFGGGIDSIVTVEQVKPRAEAALFIMSRPGDLFDAIERPAAAVGLPVVRAGREIDQQLLRSRELGFLNGHVPVTGILSAVAVLAAVLDDRDSVIMSNEWSASIPTLEADGKPVNHQYSKSASFEAAFRGVLAASGAGLPDYFSLLRPRTELWVAREFAGLTDYHYTFRSCNRAFRQDRSRRLGHWCGDCDKCAFIDLILAPFLPAAELDHIFGGHEPLANPDQAERFRALLGTSAGTKPFECVGEITECRAAALLAGRREDRAETKLLQELAAEVTALPDAPSERAVAHLLRPVGLGGADEHFVPAPFASPDLLPR